MRSLPEQDNVSIRVVYISSLKLLFSIEGRKTKSKENTLANHNGRKQCNELTGEPIRIRSTFK